jgi:ribosome-associated protein
MRDIDLDVLEAALAGDTEKNARIHLQERWRKRLLNEGDAGLQAWMESYPDCDRQQIRALVRQSRREDAHGHRSRKMLFRELGRVIERSDAEE